MTRISLFLLLHTISAIIASDAHPNPPAISPNQKAIPGHDCFFRLGDFYESFDDDAKKVAEACNIVLTARDMGTGQRVPLAGVPYHALDTYLARIINAGHKVAIVEQTSDEPIKGSMTREVARITGPR